MLSAGETWDPLLLITRLPCISPGDEREDEFESGLDVTSPSTLQIWSGGGGGFPASARMRLRDDGCGGGEAGRQQVHPEQGDQVMRQCGGERFSPSGCNVEGMLRESEVEYEVCTIVSP